MGHYWFAFILRQMGNLPAVGQKFDNCVHFYLSYHNGRGNDRAPLTHPSIAFAR